MSIETLNLLLLALGTSMVILLAAILATLVIAILDYLCIRAEVKNDPTLIVPDKRRGI